MDAEMLQQEQVAQQGPPLDLESLALSQHAWLQFEEHSTMFMSCRRILRMSVPTPHCIDWGLLADAGEAVRARAILGEDTPWTRLFDLADLPTYRLITVEFLSTFRYRAHQTAVREADDEELPSDIEFSLCGQHFEMSIERFAVYLGIYYEPETVRDDFAQAPTQGEEGVMRAWWSQEQPQPPSNYNRNSRSQWASKQSPFCQFCSIPGHDTKDCRKLAWFLRDNNITVHSAPPSPMVSTSSAHSIGSVPQWMLDTGASHHVTSDQRSLHTLSEYGGPDEIILGDGKKLSISHIGNSKLPTASRSLSLNHSYSPYQRLYGLLPSYSKLKPFGRLCYPWLRPYTSSKLQPRSSRCIFLGYSSSKSAYKCLDIITHRLYHSRHVEFGKHPKCNKCNLHHVLGQCGSIRCQRCGKGGHLTKDCRGELLTKTPQPQQQQLEAPKGCFECGKPGHIKKDCPHLKNNNGNNNGPKGRAFVIGAKEARNDANLATGMYLLNDNYASVLFDTGAEKSFISKEFSKILAITPIPLEVEYTVELVDVLMS
ncbi:hypothetical protein E3N88_10571 [Mikania micrantha]|uniref:CCHC-type domain-containing protein n=1 Tax=Mikania micrantha TaxID=192012 RepID=A0A5N6PAZ7_9ASTR|nr:hypothetical protein E3N88_10571 [Mikania micrantha]